MTFSLSTDRKQTRWSLREIVRRSSTCCYTYDAVGNRLSSLTVPSLAYNSSNELLSTSRSSYTYDYNGNLTSKTDSSGTTSYAWDYENRLTSVTLPGSGGTVTFKYDPFGRRIQKSGPAGTTNFLYDGANIVADVDVSGTVLARYTQGAGIDEPLASVTGLGTAFFEADGLGSITSLSGASGADGHLYVQTLRHNDGQPEAIPIASASRAASGIRKPVSTTTAPDTTTRRSEGFSPKISLGFNGDGPNFYAYVRNNPVLFTDPFGLSSLVFNRANVTMEVLDGSGDVVGTYPAANNGGWPR